MNNPNNNMNKNRQRGRNNNHKQRSPGRNPNFGGGGGEQRPRGNAQQLMERYLQLARDATMQGDRVLSENYFQHADHYYRVLNARFEQQNGQQNNNNNNNNGQRRFHDSGQGHDRQGNYNNQGNYNGDQQPYGNEQPRPIEHQAQVHESPSAVYQQPPQPAPHADEDIGLPPGILGNGAPALAEAASELETVGASAEEPRGNQGGRGRRRGRGGDRNASE